MIILSNFFYIILFVSKFPFTNNWILINSFNFRFVILFILLKLCQLQMLQISNINLLMFVNRFVQRLHVIIFDLWHLFFMSLHNGLTFRNLLLCSRNILRWGIILFTAYQGFSAAAAFLGLFDEMLNRMRPISHARLLAFRGDESSSQVAGCNLGGRRHSSFRKRSWSLRVKLPWRGCDI